MTTFVAMARGVNVGGRTRVAMADLRALFTGLGYEDVATYIQSGNVVFRTASTATALGPAIERALEERFGHPIKVVLRTHAELCSVLDHNPLGGGGRDPARLHVTFLADRPAKSLVTALDPDAFGPDEFRVVGREVYVHCPDGYGRTKITNTFFERALAVVATTRNLKTVGELARLSS